LSSVEPEKVINGEDFYPKISIFCVFINRVCQLACSTFVNLSNIVLYFTLVITLSVL